MDGWTIVGSSTETEWGEFTLRFSDAHLTGKSWLMYWGERRLQGFFCLVWEWSAVNSSSTLIQETTEFVGNSSVGEKPFNQQNCATENQRDLFHVKRWAWGHTPFQLQMEPILIQTKRATETSSLLVGCDRQNAPKRPEVIWFLFVEGK